MQNYVQNDFNSKYKSLNARDVTCWKSAATSLKSLNGTSMGLNNLLIYASVSEERHDVILLGHSELLPYR